MTHASSHRLTREPASAATVPDENRRSVRVAEDRAQAFAAAVLQAAGASAQDADIVARSLVAAEHSGQPGHGLARLNGYVDRLTAGGTASTPWSRTRQRGPIESYDGCGGLGHVHLALAADRAATLCAAHGVGVVGVARSNHAGALGTHARRIAERGAVALLATNAPAVLSPPGGVRGTLGTNPIALAAPVPNSPPLVCDLASSQATRGDIMRAAQNGDSIPLGWALDAAGDPTEDPHAALRGTLTPIGGPKGFALALIVEVLTGVLLGPAVGPEIRDFFGEDLSEPQGVAHFVLALDPGAFGEDRQFSARMGRLRDAIFAAGQPGATRLPGGRALETVATGDRAFELGGRLAASLERLAMQLDVPPPTWC